MNIVKVPEIVLIAAAAVQVTVLSPATAPSGCVATAEVYDQLTGRTWTWQTCEPHAIILKKGAPAKSWRKEGGKT
jgi:hypothetical protein